MKTLRRFNLKNKIYFLTIVTFNREKILLDYPNYFWKSWKTQKPIAWVILPEHCHIIMDTEGQSISDIIHNFKIRYSRKYRDMVRPGRVWQNRFWDHIIRNQDDLNVHIDYIHYNPIKHGLVHRPLEWKYSSIHEYREYYQNDWGVIERLEFGGGFGE